MIKEVELNANHKRREVDWTKRHVLTKDRREGWDRLDTEGNKHEGTKEGSKDTTSVYDPPLQTYCPPFVEFFKDSFRLGYLQQFRNTHQTAASLKHQCNIKPFLNQNPS